ncbi:SCP2 domain-containing protein [Gilliamella sp. B14448G11]|uniref:ubiquinone anaerobic biosynthesis accessory factor UbiT n=1 Tax=unclassified Gilliamella TaxID=2685620 RepID=UPI0018DDB81A|nr:MULTISPECIES: SCP2 domain-containing protein [unclassified Gilliamella]MBI0028389.1 SCP2 domain-containing protein [Gilliamella sp. B14448G7]MBI0030514.1 SCP2 domain-containing protein [Gilliamella sp. B14384G15]MBI0036108.1 SCP2 domain-containing protein [Gilliamella sp. B14448G11]MBI0042842.1 SCP2 domain-containing protein [Gilliamella sp. B14448G12]MBI0057810.1 SCP2 domain-containing protein [Gilliamella sp. B14384G12]
MIESQHNLLGKIHSTFVDKAPQVLGITLRCIPFNLKKQVIEQLLQLQFKHSLEDGDLDFLENRWLKIEVTDLQLIWFVSLIENKLVVSREEIADVSFIGNANDLIMIATRRQDPDTLFFQRRLIVEGDTELGLYVKNLMDSIESETMPKPLRITLEKLADLIESAPKE